MANVVEVGFNYSEVEEICRDDVRDAAVRIKVRMSRTAQDIIEIGRDLISVKKALGHGHFIRWIEAEFNWGQSQSDRFIQVAKRFGENYPDVGNLSFLALATLAAPSTPDAVVEDVTERVAKGETFTAADIKALKDEHTAEKRDLKKQIEDAKFKAKDAKATSEDFTQQMQSLRDEVAALLDKNHTLEHELNAARSAPKTAPRPTPTIDESAAYRKWCDEMERVWRRGSQDWQDRWISDHDTPVFDRSAA